MMVGARKGHLVTPLAFRNYQVMMMMTMIKMVDDGFDDDDDYDDDDDDDHAPSPCKWFCSLVSFACHQTLTSTLSFPVNFCQNVVNFFNVTVDFVNGIVIFVNTVLIAVNTIFNNLSAIIVVNIFINVISSNFVCYCSLDDQLLHYKTIVIITDLMFQNLGCAKQTSSQKLGRHALHRVRSV